MKRPPAWLSWIAAIDGILAFPATLIALWNLASKGLDKVKIMDFNTKLEIGVVVLFGGLTSILFVWHLLEKHNVFDSESKPPDPLTEALLEALPGLPDFGPSNLHQARLKNLGLDIGLDSEPATPEASPEDKDGPWGPAKLDEADQLVNEAVEEAYDPPL